MPHNPNYPMAGIPADSRDVYLHVLPATVGFYSDTGQASPLPAVAHARPERPRRRGARAGVVILTCRPAFQSLEVPTPGGRPRRRCRRGFLMRRTCSFRPAAGNRPPGPPDGSRCASVRQATPSNRCSHSRACAREGRPNTKPLPRQPLTHAPGYPQPAPRRRVYQVTGPHDGQCARQAMRHTGPTAAEPLPSGRRPRCRVYQFSPSLSPRNPPVIGS